MIIYWRDAASTWEVDTAFKPSGVLFSIAPDMIIYWSFWARRHGWKVALQLNTSGIASNGEQESLNGNNLDFGCT
ncbi:hypothetical protein RGQ29_026164 [Quercus rubra]|uniref:Uncharacterized protein n=1 Tax=Quercus rubra TaxID=3512 RepID=A0AAN7EZR6_QUERU|nr:hypothetical protein RGQ29_026164 [Quercus rubra]